MEDEPACAEASQVSKEPVADTLLDLRAREVALVDGVVLVNDRASRST